MHGYVMAITNACTLVTLNYIALKLRTRVESLESIAVPILTGIASIVMMATPMPENLMIMDFRFAPIVMAGLRFGLVLSLLSTILPAAYLLLLGPPDWIFGMTQGLLLPAIVSALFHREQYRTGYVNLKIRDGLLICTILFVLRASIGFFSYSPVSLADWLLANGAMLLISCAAIVVLIAMFNDESQSWLAQRQLEMQANQDNLTKLPNLRSFMAITQRTMRKQRIAILMIDIDNFKQYNDRHGHLQGDKLLQEVGQLLRNLIRDQDYVARYGGEEFIAMCLSSDTRQLKQIAERLCTTIAGHMFDGQPHSAYDRISISIGVAISRHLEDDLLRIIADADEALYESKNTGKNKYTFHASEETLLADVQ